MKYDELIKELKECDACLRFCVEYCPKTSKLNKDGKCPTTLTKKAADAIAELTDRNVGKWIPVTERLPENDKTVLVWNRRNSREYFDIYDHGRWIILEWEDITHWMPLPEPPKEEK